jgi:hypothetical protein
VLHVGLDEAGYGPMLGPLVIGMVAFRLPEGSAPGEVDLRARLKGIVVKRPRAADCRTRRLPVPVDDSKAIHGRFGLEGLARGVGAFAAAMDTAPPADLDDLLHRFSDRQPGEFAGSPWYADLEGAVVPRYPWTGPLEPKVRSRGLQALDLRVLPMDAWDLNEHLARTNNKASVLGIAHGLCLLSLLDRHPAEDAEVVVDRHGGRLDYAGYLAHLFPFARLTQRAAPRGEARYLVELPHRSLHVRFVTRGDQASLAVGWASMAAKLARELFMDRLNAWFAARRPDVRHTAGYFRDGRRFLREVEDVLVEEGIDRRRLVRAR